MGRGGGHVRRQGLRGRYLCSVGGALLLPGSHPLEHGLAYSGYQAPAIHKPPCQTQTSVVISVSQAFGLGLVTTMQKTEIISESFFRVKTIRSEKIASTVLQYFY
jgi:hypothetical protein